MRSTLSSLTLLALCVPIQAQWTRTVFTGKGESNDTPGAHSLSYFKKHGQIQKVGELAGFRFWNLSRGEELKSILIQKGPDRYIEIYHLEPSGPLLSLSLARIVKSGDESILATEDSDGGNGGGCWESYWWFDKAGPHAIDFSTMRPAIAKQVPAGSHFSTGCSEIHLEAQEIESWVQAGDAECHACGSLGHVTAHFRLHGARVEPLSVDYVADPK